MLFRSHHGLQRPALTYYRDVPDWPDQLGATIWPYTEELFIDHFVGQRTVDYLQSVDFDRPLFLWAGFAGPHDPYDVPASALSRYDGVEVPAPLGADGELDAKPPPQRAAMEGMEGKHTPAAIWWSRATPERIARLRRHYYANISLVDDWVGRIAEALEARGQLEQTLFVFTSDHGDCLGDHNQIYKFSSHYDSVARVPLVMAGPGVQKLGVREALVELIDLGPTLLDLAGLDPLEDASGQSLRPLLEGDDEAPHEVVFSEHGPRVMARTHAWKLVFYPGQPYGELYDLRSDPGELTNLYDAPEHGDAQRQMVEHMLHWYARTRMRRAG